MSRKIYRLVVEQVSNIIVMEKASKSVGVEEVRPTRDSIIEKLKRFFRSRPTIESLKEKGIYKRIFFYFFFCTLFD